MNATLYKHGLTVAVVCASYPLALAGQVAVDAVLGDALLPREVLYGSRRLLAAAVLSAWLASLPWAFGIWLLLALLRRWLPQAYAAVVTVGSAVLIFAATQQLVPAPSLFAWLLLACFVLESARRTLVRIRVNQCS